MIRAPENAVSVAPILKGVSMGWLSDKGKEGTWIEGRSTDSHHHKSGGFGRDIRADKVSYRGGEEVGRTTASGWGKSHDDSGSSGGDSGK